MVKESLYCVTSKRKINKQKATVYHCERDVNEPAQHAVQQSPKKCPVCNKSFKDERCLKIHKTKMKHGNAPPIASSSSSSSSSSARQNIPAPVQPQQKRPSKRQTSFDISPRRNKRYHDL